MGKSLVSNPPYSLKWTAPPFAQIQQRFVKYVVPPNSKADYAFILTALDLIDDKAALLLPAGVLTSKNSQEAEIRKRLVENNLIEAVILLPDKMFEATAVQTCVFVLNKNKKTRRVEMIDVWQECVEEQRDQRGQFGSTSHTNRVYHKRVNVLTDEGMSKAIKAIEEQLCISDFCKAVSIEEIRDSKYILSPPIYIEHQERDERHRDYADIAADYNRIVSAKNALKLTVNESLAKALGLYEIFVMMKNQPDVSDAFAAVGQKAEKENFISLSKNAAEFKVENKSKERLPEILSLFLQMWKQHIMYLNNEENRILAEFRDALLPDLMSGKINLNRNDDDG